MTIAAPVDVRTDVRRLPRLLRATSPDLGAHLAAFGPMPQRPPTLEDIEGSGLTGRGGAGFPVHRKLRGMAAGGIVIGNGSEGEPLSGKDALLLTSAPHLVLDGLLLAAQLVGARHTLLVLKASQAGRMRRAIAERADARSVVLRTGGGGFVTGEASALVAGIETGRSRPTDRLVRLTESGLRRRPTLVQNVETLAALAVLARCGVDRYTDVGDPRDPGSRLLTLAGDLPQPGVVEAPGGLAVGGAIGVGGAVPERVRAVLVGGYHGVWVDDLDLRLAPTAGPGFVAAGAGVLSVLGRERCGLATTARIARYLAGQSARQCGPCLNGLPAIADVLERVAHLDRDPRLPAEVERLAGIVTGSGACNHPDGTARLVRSAIAVFADDVHAHLAGRCEAHP